MQPVFVTYEDAAERLSWPAAVEALRVGHRQPKAEIGDLFLGPDKATMLTRAAYIEGIGYGIKSVTVFADNAHRGLPTVQGAMFLFDPSNGHLRAVIDSRLVTEFKTAADSVLGAQILARPDSRHLLVVGAGTVARSLIRAYSATMPSLDQISVWARRREQACALVESFENHRVNLVVVDKLSDACAQADIIATATMAQEPILNGAWIKAGTHIDLIGAFKANMREADDSLISMGSLFVDSRATTIGHIGEIMIPLRAGVIREVDIKGDLYDLIGSQSQARRSADEVTIFKNGGGAHLDLMMGTYILNAVSNGNQLRSSMP